MGCLTLLPPLARAQPDSHAAAASQPAGQPSAALQDTWSQWLQATVAGLTPEAALSQLQQAPAQFTALSDYHYWLGVYLQASKQPLEQAANAFELALLTDPNHAGAWFDYGLLQCRMGFESNCQSILAEARRRFGTPPQAKSLHPAPASWQGNISIGLGHSSNYNQGSSSQSIPIQWGGQTLSLELANSSRPTASAYQWQALDLAYRSTDHPQYEARLGLTRRTPMNAQAELGGLDSHAVELIWHAQPNYDYSLQLQTIKDGDLGSLKTQGLRWLYKLQPATAVLLAVEQRQPESPQPAYQTVITEVRQTGRYAGTAFHAALSAEKDLPQDQRPGRSQIRLQAAASLEQPDLLPWHGKLRLTVRLLASVDEQAYSPLFGDTRRQNIQTETALRLSWPLTNKVELQTELRHFNQQSNLALFKQTETQFNCTLGYRF